MVYDYGVFERVRVGPHDLGQIRCDLLLSAFNDSERVRRVFDEVDSRSRAWIVFPEYEYQASDVPSGSIGWWAGQNEPAIDGWRRLLADLGVTSDVDLCIDITGMVRPYLLALPLVLKLEGFTRVAVLYSDPSAYLEGTFTTFTKGPVERVAIVPGFAGSTRVALNAREHLVIGAGYDHELVRAVAVSRSRATHSVMLGMPSLQAHMFQESLYRVSGVREDVQGFSPRRLLYAPAADPFMVAQVLSDHVATVRNVNRVDNVYLAPVGPKPQVLGFAWYYLCEGRGSSTTLVFPFAKRYSRETSSGLAAVHRLTLELDAVA